MAMIWDELLCTERPRKSTSLGDHRAEFERDYDRTVFSTPVIRVPVDAVVRAFQARYHEIMAGSYKGELVRDCDAWPLIDSLKTIGRKRVYVTSSNLKLELMGRKVICDLMDVFWEGAQSLPVGEPPKPKSFAGKAGALLSENYRRVFQNSIKQSPDLPEAYHRLQLVTDYICGMTDSFAKRLHTELFNG